MRVPKEFQTQIKVAYPDGNKPVFEEWFNGWYAEENAPREYLGINWTSYYVNNSYGHNKKAIDKLQHYLNGLPDKKYFTVLQYDDGILNDLSRFDIKVFGSGGGRIDFPIPLICHPHGRQENGRDIFCNFVGSLTHQIRRDLVRKKYTKDYCISTAHHDIKSFCNILSRSIFTLCPRGYGATSFRICEALEQGSIPVYVSDRFIKPFNHEMTDYAVMIEPEHIDDIDLILKSLSGEQIKSMQEAGRHYYNEYFTFQGCRKHIIENI